VGKTEHHDKANSDQNDRRLATRDVLMILAANPPKTKNACSVTPSEALVFERFLRDPGITPQGSIYPTGTRFHIPDFSLISGSPGDKASTRSRGPVTRVTCHGNQDSLRLVLARAVARDLPGLTRQGKAHPPKTKDTGGRETFLKGVR